MEKKVIAIIGTGLIGGSFAIRLHEKKISSKIIGVDSNNDNALKALELELIDEVMPLKNAIEISDVLVLAIPVDKIVNLLPELLDKISETQMIIDLGSSKHQITEIIKDHPRRKRYLAAHPMWGTEYSGPQAAVKGAFENKAVIFCNTGDTDADITEWARYVFKKIGMHIIEMNAASHDLHAAYISHISHITSFALANTVLEKEKEEQAIFELASAGFESTVRLAKSNAAMWVPIFMQNRINILDVLNEHITQLEKFRDAIDKKDRESLQNLIEGANKIRKIIG